MLQFVGSLGLSESIFPGSFKKTITLTEQAWSVCSRSSVSSASPSKATGRRHGEAEGSTLGIGSAGSRGAGGRGLSERKSGLCPFIFLTALLNT